MNTVKARAALLLILATIAVGGCVPDGGSSGEATVRAPATTTAATTVATITIRNFDYGAPVSVPPGAVVTVTNLDSAGHTVTVDQGSAFDVEVRCGGETATFTAPSAPGSYPYHSTFHPGMHGTLTVK
jgi:plastocyanin